ncbi:MAG: hypothetical protein N2Z21_01750, partial [Candidatus Sumerlaeaceae bacterium]|nr:hypothetical protein [Candidatus Sumerlaeaceae bacterium]
KRREVSASLHDEALPVPSGAYAVARLILDLPTPPLESLGVWGREAMRLWCLRFRMRNFAPR